MSKEFVFMRDLISKYHPTFKASADLVKFGLENPHHFYIEGLVEETLAVVGDLKFVDAEGYDFLPDYSDSKTVSVNEKSHYAEIGGVENKIGPLRISLYNPITESLAFFFVPKSHLSRVKMPCYGVNSHKERVKFSYSKVCKDSYGWFDDYRVGTFEELALAR